MGFKGELYPFQKTAADRALERGRLLIAYHMGLGKTPLSLYVTETLLDEGDIDMVLVLAPASLKYQWRSEIKKFTEAESIVIDGSPKQRQRQYRQVAAREFDYVIMNYEQVVNDWETIKLIKWPCVVADEVQAIKNVRSKRTRRVKKLKARYRYGLTGQPIENRPEELYSIMQWLDPEVLGDFEVFDRTFIRRNRFGGVQMYRNLPLLRKTMEDVMVRKTRRDPEVRDQMPSVVEEVYTVDFDKPGAALYRSMAAELLEELQAAGSLFQNFDLWSHYNGAESGAAFAARGRIMSKLTCLRMLCDHPDLLRESARLKSEGAVTGIKGGSVYAAELAADGRLDGLKQTPKLDALMDLVKDLLDADPANKVVVFSFFKSMVHRICAAASPLTESVAFTGDLKPKERQAAKERFQSDPNVRLFVSSDAGGTGLDIPAANYLISYDLPWSAGKLAQRNARIIRLSSEWDSVTLVSLVMTGSVEERQYRMLEEKQAIASAWLDGKGVDKKGQLVLDPQTLTRFLRESSV